MLSVGILTYNSPKTLNSSLLSYKSSGLLDYTDDVMVVIQPSDKAEEEKKICESIGIKRIFMNTHNTMMAGGIDLIQSEAKYDYVLFSECDFRACIKKDKLYKLLDYGLNLLKNDWHFFRLRSLKNPGHPLINAKQRFESNWFEHAFSNIDHNLQELYLITHLDSPEKLYPNYIKKINDSPVIYQMNSKYCVYTNNPHIISKKFYNDYIKYYAQQGGHLEPEILDAWPSYNLDKIAISEGAFTHQRLDGHSNCSCCDIASGGISDFCVFSWCFCEKNTIIPGKVFEESDLQ